MADVGQMLDLLRAWFSIPINVTMVATVVIALATLLNVWVSYRTARVAKGSADATKVVADVTRANFDVAHRPYLALSNVRLEAPKADGEARITIQTKNYGNVPLRVTQYDIRALVADEKHPDQAPLANRFVPTGPGVVLPNDTAAFYCSVTDSWIRKISIPGDMELSVIADLTYVPLGGDAEYRSQSKHKYNAQLGVFGTVSSKMS